MIAIVGDIHGDMNNFHNVLKYLDEHNVHHFIQVGDLIPRLFDFNDVINEMENYLNMYNITMYFIDGNHDHHEKLTHTQQLAPHIIYQQRGSQLKLDNKNFIFIGGAYSIQRSLNPFNVNKLDKLETISDEDENRVKQLIVPEHSIIIAHDIPIKIKKPKNLFWWIKESKSSKKQRNLLQWMLDRFNPDMYIHGHYHTRYQTNYKNTTIIGLSSNHEHQLDDQILILS